MTRICWRRSIRVVAKRDAEAELDAKLLSPIVLSRNSYAHWIEAFDAAGVPVGPVHTIGEALEHPQTRARGMVVDLHHAQAGPTRALACPLHFSRTPTVVARPAPMLGEHTREVLREYGYQDAEIDRFVAEGVVEVNQSC